MFTYQKFKCSQRCLWMCGRYDSIETGQSEPKTQGLYGRSVKKNGLWNSEILGSWRNFGKQMKMGFWVEILSKLSNFAQKMRQDEKLTFLHFLWSELESSLCTGLWFSNIEWKDCWVQFFENFENVKKLSLVVSVSSHLNIVLQVNYASHPKLQLNPPRRKAT